jgi:hypothetical protein
MSEIVAFLIANTVEHVSARVRISFSSLCRDIKRSVLHHARLLSLSDSDLSSNFGLFLSPSQSYSLNMSSWSGSGYPPPRGRSRSRSPYRAGYPPPRSESSYPPQEPPYRSDWDAYERERAWAQYDRERAGYEYSRRGRSRSPPADEGLHVVVEHSKLTDVVLHYFRSQATQVYLTVGA